MLAIILTGVGGLPPAAAAEPELGSARVTDVVPAEVVVLDPSGLPTDPDILEVAPDSRNRTVSIHVSDSDSETLTVLMAESWLRTVAPYPGFLNVTFDFVSYLDQAWYRVVVEDPARGLSFQVIDFRPDLGRPTYSRGSPFSVKLERAMFISLEEIPRIEQERVTRSNDNGTWTEDVPRPVIRLGINFADVDATGQTVTLNRSWLGAFGLTNPIFEHADGSPIANTSDPFFFYIHPDHFSVLYVFTTDEEFTKENYQPYSNVFRDSANRNIYVLSDRRDQAGTNERMSSPAPVVYDQTTSFTVRATWKISQKGHWQLAVPVFFMASGNTRVDMRTAST